MSGDGDPRRDDTTETAIRLPEDERERTGASFADAVTVPSAGRGGRDDDDLPTGYMLAGKYEIIRLIGAGGMGRVYKGEHLSLGIPIAIKTMHPIYASIPRYVRRFRREAHATSLLSHPNVVKVLDFGEHEGMLYLVMEFLEGGSLARYLGKLTSPPPLSEVAHIMEMLLDALSVAHSYGIVHRDLKPENVLLAEVSGKTVAKVLDFGLAHVDDARDSGPTLTAKDAVGGTPDYMSPEQCRSLVVSPSADLYSLGCLMTALLQRSPPFRAGSVIEVMAKHMFSPPPPLLRPLGAEPVPELLEQLRLDLLAKLPEGRPKSAVAAKERLLEAMSKEAGERRLPSRKSDALGGDRQERAPVWEAAEERASPTVSIVPRPRAVALLRVSPPGESIGAECETGLSMQRIELTPAKDVAALSAAGLAVVLLDAGSNLKGARDALAEIRALVATARVVVCASDLTAAKISELVAAGAADVVRYPVAPDTLAQKLDRVLRRGR